MDALAMCRWGEVSGKHIELKIGDICDFEFFSAAFQASAGCRPSDWSKAAKRVAAAFRCRLISPLPLDLQQSWTGHSALVTCDVYQGT